MSCQNGMLFTSFVVQLYANQVNKWHLIMNDNNFYYFPVLCCLPTVITKVLETLQWNCTNMLLCNTCLHLIKS